MELAETITSLTLNLNLILSLLLAILYGIGFFRVSKTKVDGNYKLTKFTLLFLFVDMIIKGILQVVIYALVIYYPEKTTEALYIENLKNLLINLGFIANAIMLSEIVRRGTRK